MANLSVTTNITSGINFSFRYHKATDVTPAWIYGTATVNPFVITTTNPINTNYIIEVYNICSSSNSGTSSYTTHYFPTPAIQSISTFYGSKYATVNDGLCNTTDNSYIFGVAVKYTGMKNDVGQVTSSIKIVVDGITYTFTPSYADSTAISTTRTDGVVMQGEIFYFPNQNSDGASKAVTVNETSNVSASISQNYTAPAPCTNPQGNLTVYANDTAVTTIVNDISNKTCIANIKSYCTVPLPYGTHSLTIMTQCSGTPHITINGVDYAVTSASNSNTYNIKNDINNPNIVISVNCV